MWLHVVIAVCHAPLLLEFSTKKESETLIFIPWKVVVHVLREIMDLDPSFFFSKYIRLTHTVVILKFVCAKEIYTLWLDNP